MSAQGTLNDARRPRGMVKITWSQPSGETVTDEVAGWLEWEVTNNAFYQADTFRVTFAQSGLPAAYGLAWWAAQQQIWIEILAGFPADPDNVDEDELTSWIYGMVDDIHYDPANRTIEVSGRDLTALLIETRTTQKWQNVTSSEIVQQIALGHSVLETVDRHGNPTVAPTTALAGRSCEKDTASMTDEQSEWDLLTSLAQQEGFVVFVRGPCLYFQPKPDPAAAIPYVIEWSEPGQQASAQAAVKSLSFSRNLTLARDVVVQVQSWTLDDPTKPFVKTATATHARSMGTPQAYKQAIPNLTPDQAGQKAQALLAELTAHEIKLSASLPADDMLDVTRVIQVAGTHSDFDQLYYPEEVVRHMSMEEGYSMQVSAKSSSPLSMGVA